MFRSATVYAYAYFAFAAIWLTVSACLAASWFDNPAAIAAVTGVLYLAGGVLASGLALGVALLWMPRPPTTAVDLAHTDPKDAHQPA